MIIPYPTHLPKPSVGSNITLGSKFFYNGSTKIPSMERLIKENDILSLKFKYNKEEYIEFEDFLLYDIENGASSFSILFFSDYGELKKLEVEIFDDINVIQEKNNFNVNFNVVVKRKIN